MLLRLFFKQRLLLAFLIAGAWTWGVSRYQASQTDPYAKAQPRSPKAQDLGWGAYVSPGKVPDRWGPDPDEQPKPDRFGRKPAEPLDWNPNTPSGE